MINDKERLSEQAKKSIKIILRKTKRKKIVWKKQIS